jgi:plasmid maintenance system antidote protein VapI
MPKRELKKHPGHHMISAPLMFLKIIHLNQEITAVQLREKLEFTESEYGDLLGGVIDINEALAKRMEDVSGVSSGFWMNWQKSHAKHLDYLSRVNKLCQSPHFLGIYTEALTDD